MKNKSIFKSGFTLIELLVVVAIISILASIVLASLNSARIKGIDSAIKGTLANSRAQAALFYDNNNNVFTNVCTNTGGIGPMIMSGAEKLAPVVAVGINSDAFVYDPTGATVGSALCHDSVTAWAAMVSLRGGGLSGVAGWCVDSTGASGEVDTLAANATSCQ